METVFLNDSTGDESPTTNGRKSLLQAILPLILVILISTTAIGNILVILAIIREKSLRSTSNYLILSLAITDLLVACVVMPIGTVYEVTGEWQMGSLLCDIWLAADVMCCTASILHLLAIACDRYLALTNLNYIHSRGNRHLSTMIAMVWLISAVVSFAPIFGWKDPDFEQRLHKHKVCLYSQDIAYQLFATFCSFYGPLVLILCLYYRIFQEAKKRIRRKRTVVEHKRSPEKSVDKLDVTVAVASGTSSGITSDTQETQMSDQSRTTNEFTRITSSTLKPPDQTTLTVPALDIKSKTTITFPWIKRNSKPVQTLKSTHDIRVETMSSAKERRAAKILMIITGVFICCWLPFFILVLVMPLCPRCNFSRLSISFCLWLGWLNSMINPILYTIFSRDFRTAFKRMLRCGR